MKNKKKLIIIAIAVVVLAVIVFCAFCFGFVGKKSVLRTAANNSMVSKSKGYKTVIRINGLYYVLKNASETIVVNNYNNTDLRIEYTDNNKATTSKLSELLKIEPAGKYTYIIKDGKKYLLKSDNTLEETKEVLYSDTDVYLQYIKDIKNIKKTKEENTFTTYEGTLSNKLINKILKKTDLDYLTKEDAKVEVTIDALKKVSKVVYKFEKLTIQVNYEQYGKTSKINLDVYKAAKK